ncbi:unnamed protein product, partial [Laminaria digitata]
QRPELLSRFIPPDPWVGRVSLSSPQMAVAPEALAALGTAHGITSNGNITANGNVTANGNITANGNATANGNVTANGNATANGNSSVLVGSDLSPVPASSPGSVGGVAGVAGGRTAKGVSGLRNEGNWCYLNASLQALARCTPFRAHLVECSSSTDVTGRPCPLAFAMSKLYADMWSGEGRRVQTPSLGDSGVGDGVGGGGGGGEGGGRVQSATGVLRALVKGNRWFAGDGQHDAHEALRSILNLLHEELRRPV